MTYDNSYTRLELGREAFDWVKKTLSEGFTLSRFILEKVAIDSGVVITYLPHEADIERAKTEFNESVMPLAPKDTWVWLREQPDGKKPVAIPVQTTDSPQLEIIKTSLNNSPNSLFVCEDMMMRWSDKYAQTITHPLWTYEEELYHIIFHNDFPTIGEIRQVISHSDSAWQHFVGVITSLDPAPSNYVLRKVISDNEINTLVKNTQALLIGAYDNDGYLLWSRS
ncbi:MAG: hypothetical protein JW712_01795 [Dehalococcoidales bacterium]|nr:hypothetical protein [Dehalococcoidales bacterium]